MLGFGQVPIEYREVAPGWSWVLGLWNEGLACAFGTLASRNELTSLDALKHLCSDQDILHLAFCAVHRCRAETRSVHLHRSTIGSLMVRVVVSTNSSIDRDMNTGFAEGVCSGDRARARTRSRHGEGWERRDAERCSKGSCADSRFKSPKLALKVGQVGDGGRWRGWKQRREGDEEVERQILVPREGGDSGLEMSE